MRALVVDDDPIALALLENILKTNGFEVDTAQNGVEALENLRTRGARLMITDWEMPVMNGLELCNAVRAADFDGYVYIIMITAKDQPQQKIAGLNAGADNFVPKPVNPAELNVCLKTARRILALETRDLAMFALAKLAESRDPETGSHVERVQRYARLLAHDLSNTDKYRGMVDAEYVGLIYQTTPLHDIGKVGIPDPVLLKPGKLNDEEMTVMRTHTHLGAQTLDAALQRFPGARFLEIARDIAATHHERYDGTGYPHKLAGEQIPLCGRIVALADVYDALTSRRIYKKPISHEDAKTIIVAESGAHFDPDVVNAFLRVESQFIAVRQRLTDVDNEDALSNAAPIESIRAGLTNPGKDGILIVEEDPSQHGRLESILLTAGHHVVTASNANEAYQLFIANSPRLVVTDWSLPASSTLDLCKRIRALDNLPFTQFIIVTAFREKQQLMAAFDAGVDDFLREPFDPMELIARVRAGLRIVRLHDDLAAKNHGSRELNQQLSSLNQRLEKLVITDDLTGVYNRRHAMARLEEQWALADRYGRSLTIALVDIDHFKQINDSYGHAAGDVALRQVTQILKDCVRTTDTVCRVGGDEFLIIFPAQSVDEAMIAAERARVSVENQPLSCFGKQIQLTISVGISSRTEKMSELGELMAHADAALYASKLAGRNTAQAVSMPAAAAQ